MKASGIKAPSRLTKVPVTKPGDDFIIGDRVIVAGNKHGRIMFLGETKFQTGDWAGVFLDKPEGKHDGTVQGCRYFQCDPLHGIFLRPSKLVRETAKDLNQTATTKTSTSDVDKAPKSPELTVNNLKNMAGSFERSKLSGIRSPASSIRSLRFGTPSRKSMSIVNSGLKREDLKLGDRVTTGDSKTGAVRFVGETEFAKGCWVGIELDEAIGKNDGSVNNKRYFQCDMNFGLFAMIHKCRKVGFPATGASARISKGAVGTRNSVGKKPAGSVASLASLTSLSSMKRPSKIRTEVSSRYKQKTATSERQALQEELVEKQQHVEALLAERDMERSEMMELHAAAALKDQSLNQLKASYDLYVNNKEKELNDLRDIIDQMKKDKENLQRDLDEEKHKNEDIQFQYEEVAICKEDLENENSMLKTKAEALIKTAAESPNHETRNLLDEPRERADMMKPDAEMGSTLNSELIMKKEIEKKLNVVMKEKEEVQEKLAKMTDLLQKMSKEKDDVIEEYRSAKVADESRDIIESLKEQLLGAQEENQRKSQTCEDLKKDLKDLTASSDELKIKSKELTKLQQECSQLQISSDNYKEETEEKISKLYKELEAARSHAVSVENNVLKTVSDENLKLTQLQATYDDVVGQLQTERMKRNEVTETLEQIKQDRSEDLKSFKSKESKLIFQFEEIGRKFETSQQSLLNSNQQVERLSVQLASLTKTHNDTLQAMSQETDQKTENLVLQLRKSHEAEKLSQEELKNYRKDLEEMKKAKKQIEMEVSELVNKMEITKNEHLNSQKKLEESQQEVARLQQDSLRRSTQAKEACEDDRLAETLKQLKLKRVECKRSNQEVIRLKELLKRANDEMCVLKSSLNTLEQQWIDMTNLVQELKRNESGLRRAYAIDQVKLRTIGKAIISLEERASDLERDNPGTDDPYEDEEDLIGANIESYDEYASLPSPNQCDQFQEVNFYDVNDQLSENSLN